MPFLNPSPRIHQTSEIRSRDTPNTATSGLVTSDVGGSRYGYLSAGRFRSERTVG